jgi:hypothetical protein
MEGPGNSSVSVSDFLLPASSIASDRKRNSSERKSSGKRKRIRRETNAPHVGPYSPSSPRNAPGSRNTNNANDDDLIESDDMSSNVAPLNILQHGGIPRTPSSYPAAGGQQSAVHALFDDLPQHVTLSSCGSYVDMYKQLKRAKSSISKRNAALRQEIQLEHCKRVFGCFICHDAENPACRVILRSDAEDIVERGVVGTSMVNEIPVYCAASRMNTAVFVLDTIRISRSQH